MEGEALLHVIYIIHVQHQSEVGE